MGFDYNSPLVKMVPKDTTEEQREIEHSDGNSQHQSRQLQGGSYFFI